MINPFGVDIDISDHIALAISITLPFTKVRPVDGTPEYDWAIDGLLYAQSNYNPSFNTKFSTYATYCIRGYILNGIRKSRNKSCVNPICCDMTDFAHNNGSEWLLPQVKLQWSIDISECLNAYPIHTPADAIDKSILIAYYLHSWTLKEIGQKFGMGKERVRQRRERALEVMRKLIAA